MPSRWACVFNDGDSRPSNVVRVACLAACAFSNQKTQVRWRIQSLVNSRTKPLVRSTPNNRSHERLFGGRVEIGPFRSFTRGQTHQKRCNSWFENTYARVFAVSANDGASHVDLSRDADGKLGRDPEKAARPTMDGHAACVARSPALPATRSAICCTVRPRRKYVPKGR